MTYYVKFTDGPERATETQWFDAGSNIPDGWYVAGDDAINKFYRLVDNSAVQYTQQEEDEYREKTLFESSLRDLRLYRYSLLGQSDWTQNPDSPISPEKREEWKQYRQAIRDITNNLTTSQDVLNVVWPDKPN